MVIVSAVADAAVGARGRVLAAEVCGGLLGLPVAMLAYRSARYYIARLRPSPLGRLRVGHRPVGRWELAGRLAIAAVFIALGILRALHHW